MASLRDLSAEQKDTLEPNWIRGITSVVTSHKKMAQMGGLLTKMEILGPRLSLEGQYAYWEG